MSDLQTAIRTWRVLRGALALFIVIVGLMSAQAERPKRAHEITAADLVACSPYIAVIEIAEAPPARGDDASNNPQIYKQRAEARLVTAVRGALPETFRIENEANSVLTPGRKLAFLEQISPTRYILSSPVSLRRISGDTVYWFPHTEVPLREVLASLGTKS